MTRAAAETALSLSTLDLLYLALALGIIILVIALTVLIVNLTMLVRDARKVTDTVGDISEKVHQIVITPVSIISSVIEKAGPYIEGFIAGKFSNSDKDKSKKKKS